MRVFGLSAAAAVVTGLLLPNFVVGFAPPKSDVHLTTTSLRRQHQPSSSSSSSLNAALLLSPSILSVGSVAAAAGVAADASSSSALSIKEQREQERDQQIRREGGLFTIRTKYGALNPYALYYGTVSVLLGIPWFMALLLYQLFAFITRDKIDKNRLIPILMSHAWGMLLLRLTRSYPTIENQQLLVDFYKEKRPAMFVANHCSWMDIPFMGVVIGWRNYKIIAKKELRKVPILGRAIQVGGHVMVDRSSRKSQLKTLKDGIAHLKNGVHLCTFPEGTRSKSGRLHAFKNGAFKMAQKAGAPVVPLSICNAHKVNPPYWIFPFCASHGIAKVVVHAPIESVGKTEKELAEAVRLAMISGLPDDQKPLPPPPSSKPDNKTKTTTTTTTTEAAAAVTAAETKMEASSVMTTTTATTTPAVAAHNPNGDSTNDDLPLVQHLNGDISSTENDLLPLGTIHIEKKANFDNAAKVMDVTTTTPSSELLKEEKTA